MNFSHKPRWIQTQHLQICVHFTTDPTIVCKGLSLCYTRSNLFLVSLLFPVGSGHKDFLTMLCLVHLKPYLINHEMVQVFHEKKNEKNEKNEKN
jgi:hypothetical protein